MIRIPIIKNDACHKTPLTLFKTCYSIIMTESLAPPQPLYNIIAWTSIIICVLLYVAITVYHVKTLKKFEPSKLRPKQICKSPAIYLSFLLILSGFILMAHAIGGNASHTWRTSQLECQILLLTSVPTSSIFKAIIYTLFVNRIWKSYGNSGMGYSKRLLSIWAGLLITWSIFNSVLNLLFSSVEVIDKTCKYSFFFPMLGSVMMMDFIALCVNTYLFLKPIYLINQMVKEAANDNSHVIVNKNDHKKSELKLKQIAIKQFILSITAMISTMIAYPGIIIFELAQVWGSIDTVISTFCAILMYKWYDELAWKLFGSFCCCCRKWLKFHSDMEHLEREMTHETIKSGSTHDVSSQTNTKGVTNTSKTDDIETGHRKNTVTEINVNDTVSVNVEASY